MFSYIFVYFLTISYIFLGLSYYFPKISYTGGGKIPPYGFWLFFFDIKDSRHDQLLIYVFFHKESYFQVKNKQFWRLEAKN